MVTVGKLYQFPPHALGLQQRRRFNLFALRTSTGSHESVLDTLAVS